MNKQQLIYVDDDTMNLTIFEIQFKKHFDIITTNSPSDAVMWASDQNIPILITDYRMPSLNGMELIKKVKELSPATLCILLSGHTSQELDLDQELIFRFITDPFGFKCLNEVIVGGFERLGLSA